MPATGAGRRCRPSCASGRGPRRRRAARFRGHLPAPLVPGGALRRQVPGRGAEQPGPRAHRAGAARRRSSTATARRWSTTGPRSSSRSRPTSSPRNRAPPAAVRPARRADRAARRRRSARRSPQARSCPGSPATLRRDVRYDDGLLPAREPGRVPGGLGRARLRPPVPAGKPRCAPARLRRRGLARAARRPRFEALEPGDIVGRQGVESTYDSLLRGVNGETRVQVDAAATRPAAGSTSASRGRAMTSRCRSTPRSRRPGEAAVGSIGLPAGSWR